MNARRFKPLDANRSVLDRDGTLPPIHRYVLVGIVRFMDPQGRTYVSQGTLAAATGLSERTVGSVIADLRAGWTMRDGQRVPLTLPFSFTCRPKVFGPGERRTNGRPPLEYSIDLSAPVAGKSPLGNPAATSGNQDREFPEAVAGNDEGGLSANGVGVSGNGGGGIPATTADDLILTASELPNTPQPTKRKRAKQTKLFEPPSSDFVTVRDCYFASFEEARGAPPPFDGKEGKAIKNLLAKLRTPDAACAVIRHAYAPESFFRKTASIISIANDPGRFVGGTSSNGPTKLLQPSTDRAWVPPEVTR